MTFDDLLRKILNILPDAQIEEDNDGQMIIYTGKKLENESVVDWEPIDDD